jgi:DNA-binding transcriptional ArsR family regulator
MRSAPSALAPVLRSDAQARLLAVLLLHPELELSASDLARRLGVPLTTLHEEVQRLLTAGILTAREVGRSKLLRANPDNRMVGPLTELVLTSFGPDVIVREEFAEIDGVHEVVVFGSWAARFHGEAGPLPADVDVLVVGTPDRTDVYDAADRAQERLGFPVNPTVVSPGRWAAADDPLVRQVKTSPTLLVLCDPHHA